MKRLTMLLMVLLLAIPLVHGQWVAPLLKADVPFDFYVGNKSLPAGAYEINNNHIGSTPALIVRKSDSGFQAAAAMGQLSEDHGLAGNRYVLVFHKYDNDHSFLRQIRAEATKSVLDLPMCQRERDHVTNTWTPVAGGRPTKVVVLASVR